MGCESYTPTKSGGEDGSLAVDFFTFSSSIADYLRSASLLISHTGLLGTKLRSFYFFYYLFWFLAGVRRLHLSRFYLERVQKAHLYTDRTFHSLVSFQRLATWGLGLESAAEPIAHELTVRRRMTTMKENKGKKVVDEATGQGVQSQPRLSAGDKRKSLSQGVDLGNLPSRRKEKKAKHRLFKPQDAQPNPFLLNQGRPV